MNKIEGVIQEISEPKLLKSGVKKDNTEWKLWGSQITIEGEQYGITAFSKTQLEEKLNKLSLRDKVSFEYETNGKFKNIDKDAEIEVLENNVPAQEGEKTREPDSKQDYWERKFEYDKQRNEEVQKSICRTSAWKIAVDFCEVIKDKVAGDEPISFTTLKQFKNDIEKDLRFEEE